MTREEAKSPADFYATDREAFTIDEVAAILGMGRHRVLLAVKSGQVATGEIGYRKFIRRSSIERILGEDFLAKKREKRLSSQ